MNRETVSLDEAFAQIDARRLAESPWTAEDEARWQAKRDAERAMYDKWAAANPQTRDDDDDENDEDGEDDEEAAS